MTTVFLCSNGADVNAKDASGKTCLHLATSLGLVDTIGVLLSLEADPNIQCEQGTALDMAASNPVIQARLTKQSTSQSHIAAVKRIDELGRLTAAPTELSVAKKRNDSSSLPVQFFLYNKFQGCCCCLVGVAHPANQDKAHLLWTIWQQSLESESPLLLLPFATSTTALFMKMLV